jgi:hypothetical protein
MERIETTILKNLIFNEDYSRKVLPFLKNEYFESYHEKVVFEEIAKFIIEYGNLPSKEAIVIESEKRTDISDEGFKDISTLVTELNEEKSDLQWLFDTTEKWCRDRAIYLALVESISIADGKTEKKKTRDVICKTMKKDTNTITKRKLEFNSTSIFSIRLRRVGFLIKHSTLLLLALVLVSLCSCVMSQAVCYSKGRTYYTSRLRWLRRKLQRELTLIY